MAYVVRDLRKNKQPVFKADVMALANMILDKVPKLKRAFKTQRNPRGLVTDRWYNGFLERNGLVAKNVKPLDMTRASWYTSKNVRAHFNNVMAVLLKHGYAHKNPSFDPDDLDSEPIIWTAEGKRRFFEFDETGFDLKGDKPSKARAERMPCRPGDSAEAYNEHNTSDRVSGCGGTVANGEPLRPMFVFNSGQTLDLTWMSDDYGRKITTGSVDAQGNEICAAYDANEGGSFSTSQVVRYLECQKAVLPEATAEQPWIAFTDGVLCHITRDVVEYARKHHITILLKVPYLSHVLQGQDVVGGQFARIKSGFRKNHASRIGDRVREAMRARGAKPESVHSGFQDFIECVREPWMAAFNDRANNVRIWGRIGIVPFNRLPLKNVILAERDRAAQQAEQKEEDAKAPSVVASALDKLYAQRTPTEKVTQRALLTGQGRVNASDVWRACGGVATDDKYKEHLDLRAQAKAAEEADKQAKRDARAAKAARAASERRALADRHWKLMEAVQFVEERFPRENPKILARDSCIAILEMRYGQPFAELSKKKLEANHCPEALTGILAAMGLTTTF
eukprot:g6026.t1